MADSSGLPRVDGVSGAEGGVARRRRPMGKTLLLWTRTLHIYVTMFGLVLLIFFSFTGFLLNNGGSFSNSGKMFNLDPVSRPDRVVKLPVEMLRGAEHLIGIERRLRKEFGARGELETLPEEGDASIRFVFVGPGREMDFEIAKDTGETTIKEQRNILAMMTDLHTGEHAGRWWVWFIDATACFLFFASVSGLVLWLSLPKRRVLGIVALAVSLGLCLGAYFLLVP